MQEEGDQPVTGAGHHTSPARRGHAAGSRLATGQGPGPSGSGGENRVHRPQRDRQRVEAASERAEDRSVVGRVRGQFGHSAAPSGSCMTATAWARCRRICIARLIREATVPIGISS